MVIQGSDNQRDLMFFNERERNTHSTVATADTHTNIHFHQEVLASRVFGLLSMLRCHKITTCCSLTSLLNRLNWLKWAGALGMAGVLRSKCSFVSDPRL